MNEYGGMALVILIFLTIWQPDLIGRTAAYVVISYNETMEKN